MEALRKEEYYTYEDYKDWDTEDRYEIIDGAAYAIAPPSIAHQRISGELFGQLRDFLKGKPCKLFVAPVGVRLNADTRDNTVLEPDIVVICDRSKIGSNIITGAPDMVIEILSKSTASRDCIDKYQKYREAGVREYWIVDPYGKTVSVNILKDGKYLTHAYAETAAVHVLEGCTISLPDVFTE